MTPFVPFLARDAQKIFSENELTKQKSAVVERLKFIKPGQNAFNADLPPEFQLHVKAATFFGALRWCRFLLAARDTDSVTI